MRARQLLVVFVFLFANAKVRAEPPPTMASSRTLTIEAGKGTTGFLVSAEMKTRFGLIVGGGGGAGFVGPSVEAYVGYQLPFGTHWTLRPGARANRMWGKAENCTPRCDFDFFTFEMAIHYQGPSGFVFEYGVPVVAWVPVGPEAGETEPHLQLYVLSGEAIGFLSSIYLGYAFDI